MKFDLTKQDLNHILSGLTRESRTYIERAGNIIVMTDLDLQMKHQLILMAEMVNTLIGNIRQAEGQPQLILEFDLVDHPEKQS